MAVAALVALAFGVALLTLFSGFGLGTLLMPAFALVLPVEAAVASTAVVHMANNLFKAGILAGQVERSIVVRFGLPAVVSAFSGAVLLTTLSGQGALVSWSFLGRSAEVTPLKLIMGFLIIGFALFELVPALRAARAPVRWLPLGGVLSGFFGGLSGHQGALRAAFLGPLGLTPAAFAATQAVIALLVDGARLVVYGWAFVKVSNTSPALPWNLIVVATVAAFAGSYLGKRLLTKVTLGSLHLIVGVLLMVVGLALAAGVT
jgi:uncharacterized membrane protein YfcA